MAKSKRQKQKKEAFEKIAKIYVDIDSAKEEIGQKRDEIRGKIFDLEDILESLGSAEEDIELAKENLAAAIEKISQFL